MGSAWAGWSRQGGMVGPGWSRQGAWWGLAGVGRGHGGAWLECGEAMAGSGCRTGVM